MKKPFIITAEGLLDLASSFEKSKQISEQDAVIDYDVNDSEHEYGTAVIIGNIYTIQVY